MSAKIINTPTITTLWTGKRFGLLTVTEIIDKCFDAKKLKMEWHHDITTEALLHPEVCGLFQLRLDQELAKREMINKAAAIDKWNTNKKLARKFVR